MIAVIGAAGLCGTYVLEAVLRGPFRVRAVVHGPAGRDRVAALGVDDVVEADLEKPDTVRQALENADVVFMIPPAFHPEEDVLAIRALEAAEHVGARRFVYLSVLHPHTPGLRHHLRKANAEAAVRASRLNWTILQPSMFAQIVLSTWGGLRPVPSRCRSTSTTSSRSSTCVTSGSRRQGALRARARLGDLRTRGARPDAGGGGALRRAGARSGSGGEDGGLGGRTAPAGSGRLRVPGLGHARHVAGL